MLGTANVAAAGIGMSWSVLCSLSKSDHFVWRTHRQTDGRTDITTDIPTCVAPEKQYPLAGCNRGRVITFVILLNISLCSRNFRGAVLVAVRCEHSLTHCCAWPAEGRSVLHIERSWPAIQAAPTDRPVWTVTQIKTKSLAIAKRPRDAPCHWIFR